MKEFFFDKNYTQAEINDFLLSGNEYEKCMFDSCILSTVSFDKTIFIDCTFSHCDLNNVSLKTTALKGVTFKTCKLNGIHFEFCPSFMLEMNFDTCQMHYTSFFGMNLENIHFKDCDLKESDFTEVTAINAVFDGCDFLDGTFDQSNLQGADFTKAINYHINPLKNQIKKAKFSTSGLIGLVSDFGIEIIP
jgi:fluoroquinolone resistance protein